VSDAAVVRAALRRIERRARMRPDAGRHPSPQDLIAYRAGRFGSTRVTNFQRHLGLCCGCADHLLELEHFLERARPEPVTADTDASWRELRAWLTEERGGGPEKT
jgi:5-methylcytosine-specific restriction endonuclease McrA